MSFSPYFITESLYPIIFENLLHSEIVQLLCTCKSYYYQWMDEWGRILNLWDFSKPEIITKRNLVQKLRNQSRQLRIHLFRDNALQLLPFHFACHSLKVPDDLFFNHFLSSTASNGNLRFDKYSLKTVTVLSISKSRFLSIENFQEILQYLAKRNRDPLVPQFLGLKDLILESPRQLAEIPLISHLESLVIRGSPRLTDASHYGYLHKLELKECHAITDFHCFNRIHCLSIINCDGFHDPTVLHNNFQIKIEDCANVQHFQNCFQFSQEITIFGDKHNLNAINLSHYQQVKRLRLSRISTILGTISQRISVLSLSHMKLDPFLKYIPRLWKLSLTAIDDFIEVPRGFGFGFGFGFGDIPIIELHHCENLQSIEGLGETVRQRVVTIVKCPLLRDFSSLQQVETVSITECTNFCDCEQLRNVKNLTLIDCPALTSLEGLSPAVQQVVLGQGYGPNRGSLNSLRGMEKATVVDLHTLSSLEFSWLDELLNCGCPNKIILPYSWWQRNETKVNNLFSRFNYHLPTVLIRENKISYLSRVM